jgi:hypothetical protein
MCEDRKFESDEFQSEPENVALSITFMGKVHSLTYKQLEDSWPDCGDFSTNQCKT